jgi:TetR/AcrR family transcriptional regulator, cholesterol catabolism regulator
VKRSPSALGPNVIGGAPTKDDLATDRERERRERILDAAVDRAGVGGYARVHMRDVAELAGVSLATIYRHFPSKVHLLVRALERELLSAEDYLGQGLSGISNPFARLRVAVRRLIENMELSQRVTEALTHAYVASIVVASAEAEAIRVSTIDVFVHLMSDDVATELQRHTAELVADVWTSELLALVQGRRTNKGVHHRLTTVIDLLERACQHAGLRSQGRGHGEPTGSASLK